MRRSLLLLLLHAFACATLPFLAACGSTGASRVDVPGGARVILHGSQLTLRIVNDAYLRSEGVEGETAALRRAAFYSEKRTDGNTKVAEDELVAGVIQALDGEGFVRYAVDGARGAGEAGTALEVWIGDRARHFPLRKGMTPEAAAAFQTCYAAFIDVYNNVEQYQAGDQAEIQFEEPGR